MTMWTTEEYQAFWAEFGKEADEVYRLFHEKILCANQPVIGLRTPLLRKKANEIAKDNGLHFLTVCEKDKYEKRLIYGLVAANLKIPYESFLVHCDIYVNEYVDNWALCDVLCSSLKKVVKKNEADFFEHCEGYIASENPWAVRAGLVIFLGYYLNERYIDEVLRLTDSVHTEFYYVRMAQAWLLATAWAKERECVMDYLSRTTLDEWTKGKFVQKCCESYRVSQEDKIWLREWRKNGYQ